MAAAVGDVTEPWADSRYLESVLEVLEGRPATDGGRVDRGAVRIQAGLTDSELDAAEQRFDLRFPHDLRALLRRGLPTGWDWPNWRDPEADDYLRWAVGKPRRAMEFDVLNNGVWFADWGTRPDTEPASVQVAVEGLARAPRLVPVHSNRYIPCEPLRAGNPVLEFTQIIETAVAGDDLADFLAVEFGAPRPASRPTPAGGRPIAFWSAIVDARFSSRAPTSPDASAAVVDVARCRRDDDVCAD